MTENEVNGIQELQKRIDALDEEIYALFEAKGQIINPIERIIRTICRTRKKNFMHQCVIYLTLEDIRLLQDRRLSTVRELRAALEKF